MAKPDTSAIEQSIDSLRTESTPDSVTPNRVAGLLQAVVDLINALSMVPDTEVANIMQLINNAVSTANAASSAASAAQTNANNKKITQFKAEATAEGVTLTVKQSGHTAISFLFPVANDSQAGIVLPTMLQSLLAADQKAENYKVAQLLFSYTTAGARFGIRLSNGTTLEKDIYLATTARNGLMSKTDKLKLDGLPSSVIALDGAGRVPAAQAPQTMLRNVTGGAPDDLHNGDFYFDQGDSHIYFLPNVNSEPVDMGVPSKNVVYCHTDTNLQYRWDSSNFIPIATNPEAGLVKRNIRVWTSASKRYDIPPGIFAYIVPSTTIVNINLLEPSSGMPFYRIQLYGGTFEDAAVEQINWPMDLCWAENAQPSIDDIISNYGVIVTIYGTWASFKKY